MIRRDDYLVDLRSRIDELQRDLAAERARAERLEKALRAAMPLINAATFMALPDDPASQLANQCSAALAREREEKK